jgi:CHAD domain-containing protein
VTFDVAVEAESKYTLPDGAELPSFDDEKLGLTAGPKPPVVLRSVYYDVADGRLLAAGVTLRRRTRAGATTWELKVPAKPGDTSVRREIALADRSLAPPARVVHLLAAWTAGDPLVEVATLRTRRLTWLVSDGSEDVAEIVDDEVERLEGRRVVARFREVEVERRGVPAAYLERLAKRLAKAGASPSGSTKLATVLGGAPPVAAAPVKRGAPVLVLLGEALRRATADLLAADVAARLGEDDAVHQLRVACRRMRSDLRAYGAALDPAWRDHLRGELAWFASSLGAARDAEVVAARVADAAADLGPDGARVLADLVARTVRAEDGVRTALASGRYVALVLLLRTEAATPPAAEAGVPSAKEAAGAVVAAAWRDLERAVRRLRSRRTDDAAWHDVRIKAKRARYTAETASAVLPGARRTARAAAAVQDVLGVFHDTTLTRDALAALVAERPDDTAYGVAAGRLVERETAAGEATRARLGTVWEKQRR